MPVFECSRCNHLSYSSATTNVGRCEECAATRKRVIQDATTFAQAKEVPRAASFGDHSLAVFDDFEDVAALAAEFVREGKAAGALVVVAVAQGLEDLLLERLDGTEQYGLAWEPPTDMYGPLFWGPDIIDRFRRITDEEDRPVFVIGCPDQPIQTFTSLEGWLEYERMAHELAVERGMNVLCLYDARIHDERMLRAGLETHSLHADPHDGAFRRNALFDYEPPAPPV